MAKAKPKLAWHFVGSTLRDGRPVPPDGEWLKHSGKLIMCSTGLHASSRIIDAIGYAPGGVVCRVALAGKIEHDTDKMVASRRLILWRLDKSDDVLRAFARKAALSVIHLWDAPAIVKQYLETGDESIRVAAWAAARDAARAAAWAAARDAARAARDAAWDAARDAAWAAARDAARAARDAAWAAARDAAWGKFNTELEAMIQETAGNPDDVALLAKVS